VFEWDNAAAYNISFTGEEMQMVLELAAMLRADKKQIPEEP
jgi:hypothetical protein